MRHLIIGMLFLANLAYAQKSDQEYLLDYKAAVQLYASQDYDAAISKLTPLTSTTYNNAVVPYALYYFALTSFESDRAYQSRATLRDLFLRFPNWEKIDEGYYLYASSNFKDKYFEEGLNYLERISDTSLSDAVEGLMKSSIPPIENIVLLKELNQKFSNNKLIAETLVNRIQERKYNTRADLELSDRLTNLFDLIPESEINASETISNFNRSYDDEIIDFGVLFPFDLEDFDISQATAENRYVYDMFTGMEMATKKLLKENIPVKLYGFDVGRDEKSVKKYLDDEDFKKIDILVGPLYGRPNNVVEEYAIENKMYQIHPISNSRSLILDSDSRFLLQASNEIQAEKSLTLAETFDDKKSVSIYHNGSRKDSLLANVYANAAIKRGFDVIECKRFVDPSSISLGQNVGHVFISGDSYFGPNILRALGQAKIDSAVIATDASFNLETVNRNTLSKNLYLVYPQFVDSERTTVREFRRSYIDKMKMSPSYYAYLGYDLMLFYGRMLKDGKDIFRLNLNESPEMSDLLLSGFDYSKNSSENKIVPIVKYKNGRLEIANTNE